MKKNIVLSLIALVSLSLLAKKDSQAWKTEKSLESQFSVFKENSSQWNGYIMNKEADLNEFHKARLDTISNLETNINSMQSEIVSLKGEIKSLSSELSKTQVSLKESKAKEQGLTTLGINFNKESFPPLMYTIIILLIVIAAAGFSLFFRSNILTKETEKRYEEIAKELEEQRMRGMERESKLRRELQTERNKQTA